MPLQFFQFPREIRDKIYEELLLNERNVDSDCTDLPMNPRLEYMYGLWTNSNNARISIHPAIIFTCRTCAEEGTRILYHENRLHLPNIYSFQCEIDEMKLDQLRWSNSTIPFRFDRRAFAYYLPVFARFRHINIQLDYCSRFKLLEEILAIKSAVFPNIQSLRLATRHWGSDGKHERLLLSVALELFGALQFRTATYSRVEVPKGQTYGDLSMTLYTTSGAQNVEDAFFIDTEAMNDLIAHPSLPNLLRGDSDVSENDNVYAINQPIVDILEEAKAGTENRRREKLA